PICKAGKRPYKTGPRRTRVGLLGAAGMRTVFCEEPRYIKSRGAVPGMGPGSRPIMTYGVPRVCVCFACAFLLLAAFQVRAQTPPSSLTPEQLQVFENLPPDQQK